LASVKPLGCSQTLKRGFAEDYACIFGGNGEPGKTASRNCADVAYQSSPLRSRPDRRRGYGECRDIPPFNRRYATPISTRSAFPVSMFPSKLNSVEPPRYGPVCQVVWGLRWSHKCGSKLLSSGLSTFSWSRLELRSAEASLWPLTSNRPHRNERNGCRILLHG